MVTVVEPVETETVPIIGSPTDQARYPPLDKVAEPPEELFAAGLTCAFRKAKASKKERVKGRFFIAICI
jgi:hypothetical protein